MSHHTLALTSASRKGRPPRLHGFIRFPAWRDGKIDLIVNVHPSAGETLLRQPRRSLSHRSSVRAQIDTDGDAVADIACTCGLRARARTLAVARRARSGERTR